MFQENPFVLPEETRIIKESRFWNTKGRKTQAQSLKYCVIVVMVLKIKLTKENWTQLIEKGLILHFYK